MSNVSENKKIVSKFLRQCNGYADGQLRKYQERLEQASGMDALETEAKLYHWKVYKTFNDYTLEELETDALDHWFDDPVRTNSP